MNLDSLTLQIVNGVVVAFCTVAFTLNTGLKRNDAAGRQWSLGFVAGLMSVIALTAGAADPSIAWTNVVGAIFLIVAVAAIWAGARSYNVRPVSGPLIVLFGALLVVTVGATVADGMALPRGAGAVALWLSIAVLAGCGGLEFLRGRLLRDFNARIVAITLGLGAVVAGLNAGSLLTGGTGSPVMTYVQSGTAEVLGLGLVIMGTIALSVLSTEYAAGSAVGDVTHGIHSAAGALSKAAFDQAASDHLERAEQASIGLALIGADIDNLPEINTAFGRAAGDAAIAAFARKLRSTAPVMCLIGHRSSGRFHVLIEAPATDLARMLTEHFQIALAEDPLPGGASLRLTASFGIAATADHGYSLAALTDAAAAGIEAIRAAGGNAIAVEPNPGSAGPN